MAPSRRGALPGIRALTRVVPFFYGIAMKKPVSRLLQGAGLSCASLVVRIAFGLFLTPYMLSVLGDRAFGIFALSSLFAGWCGLLDFGLTTTTSRYVTRYYTKDDWEGVNETGSTAIALFGGISALVFLLACLAFLAARLLGDSFDDSGLLATALFFAGLSFAISKVADGFCGVIRGTLRQEYTGWTAFITRIAIGLTNLGVLWLGGRVIALFVANSAITALQLIAYMALTRIAAPQFHFSLGFFRKERVRSLFSYSFFAFLAQAGEIAVNRSDLIIIAALASIEEVTTYNLVVVTLVSYFNSFLTEGSSWETNWFAHLAAKERTEEDVQESTDRRRSFKEGLRRTFGVAGDNENLSAEFHASRATIMRASIFASFFGAYGILLFGRVFIERWIGAKYLVAFPALALCVAAQGLYRGSAEVNSRALQGIARHQVLAIGSILHGAANVVLSVFFVKMGLGLLGVALGTVLPGLAIHFLWIPNVACRLMGEGRRVYWRRQIMGTGVALVATIAPTLVIAPRVEPNYPSIIAYGILAFVLYLPVVFLLGLSRDERVWVKRFVKRKFLRRDV